MLVTASQKAYQLDGVRTQIKHFCLSVTALHGEQMTLPEMDFMALAARGSQASLSVSNSALQENMTAHFSITLQDLDRVMWK